MISGAIGPASVHLKSPVMIDRTDVSVRAKVAHSTDRNFDGARKHIVPDKLTIKPTLTSVLIADNYWNDKDVRRCQIVVVFLQPISLPHYLPSQRDPPVA